MQDAQLNQNTTLAGPQKNFFLSKSILTRNLRLKLRHSSNVFQSNSQKHRSSTCSSSDHTTSSFQAQPAAGLRAYAQLCVQRLFWLTRPAALTAGSSCLLQNPHLQGQAPTRGKLPVLLPRVFSPGSAGGNLLLPLLSCSTFSTHFSLFYPFSTNIIQEPNVFACLFCGKRVNGADA